MSDTPTAIDDIEALASELETAAREHREAAENAEARARQLREAADRLKPTGGKTPFTTSIAKDTEA